MIKETKFKYVKDVKGLSASNLIQVEIAHQLKRIADALEAIHSEMETGVFDYDPKKGRRR